MSTYLDAEIRPARSLSPGGLKVVMGLTIALAMIPVTIFSLMGAGHFVLPFLGLDIFGLWLAFYVMNKRVGVERVCVSSDQVEVFRAGKPVWRSATAFTRVEPGETAVRLAVSGKRMAVAAALSPQERQDFTHALDDAIRRAKRERYPGG
jgi:uncharacterized membrane protein